jgi:hypothetical protein
MPARRFCSARSALEMVPRTISFAQRANRASPCYFTLARPLTRPRGEDG